MLLKSIELSRQAKLIAFLTICIKRVSKLPTKIDAGTQEEEMVLDRALNRFIFHDLRMRLNDGLY